MNAGVEGGRVLLGTALLCALLLHTATARALPGIFVSQDGAGRTAQTAHVVLLLQAEVSVVTVMVDHQGPMTPFAVVLPVPADVTANRVQTIKREFIDRVETQSAPRYHAFYEQDPCSAGPAEQEWEHRIEARGTGFLGPHVPPVDPQWKVPKEISVPVEAVFKGLESEFTFHVRDDRQIAAFARWAGSRGYRLDERGATALDPYVRAGMKLLVAEVNVDHVELLGRGKAQFGGIRYWSKQPVTRIASTLGVLHSAGVQDLFVYVLHPTLRYAASNYPNVVPPTNLRVDARTDERIAQAYNALYDLLLKQTPGAAVTEYVWSTAECGEPCPNAPLTPRELLTLGGDIIEEQTVPRAARFPNPPEESETEREELKRQLEPLSPAAQARIRHERQALRQELARRQALIGRQRYVLSRLHQRYAPGAITEDLRIGPARSHLRGGVGVPEGPTAELPIHAQPADVSRYQVRMLHAVSWTRDMRCATPVRWRWGRRWPQLGHQLRKVWVARDLPRAQRDPELLQRVMRTALPELGLGLPPPMREPPPPRAPESSGCGCMASGSTPTRWLALAWLVVAATARRRTRRRSWSELGRALGLVRVPGRARRRLAKQDAPGHDREHSRHA